MNDFIRLYLPSIIPRENRSIFSLANLFTKNATAELIALLSFWILFPVTFALFFGVSKKDCFLFFSYVFVYHGLNGFLILSLFKEKVTENLQIPIIIVAGICYNILTTFFLSFFNYQKYAFLNVFILILAKFIFQFPLLEYKMRGFNSLRKNLHLFILLLIPIFISGTAYVLQLAPNHHFTFQGALANSLAHAPYPYFWHLNPDVPLYYNYGYHFEMACGFLVTSIPLEVLSARLYPIYIFFLLISLVYFFCKEYFEGKGVTGGLTLVNNFCVIGFSSLSTQLFLIILPSSILLVGSSILALTIFFILVDRIYQSIGNDNFSISNYLFIAFLSFVGVISRSALPPIIIGGVSLLIVTEFFKGTPKKSILRLCIITFSMGLSFLLALVFVYGYLSPYSATQFLTFVEQQSIFAFTDLPPWKQSIDSFLQSKISNELSFFRIKSIIFILLASGYLFVGFYYQVYKWYKVGISTLERFLLCCAVVGFILWNFTDAPGGSHYTFHHYASLIFGIFGANGTYLLFKNASTNWKKIYVFPIMISVALFFVKGYEVYDELRNVKLPLSFRTQPVYSSWSPKFLEEIHSLSSRKKNTVLISLDLNKEIEDNHHLNMLMQHIPCFQLSSLNYFFMRSTPALQTKSVEFANLLAKYNETKTLDDMTVEKFEKLFSHKEIIFLVNEKPKDFSKKLDLFPIDGNYHILKAVKSLHQKR